MLDSKLNHVEISTDMKTAKNAVQFAAFLFFMKIADVHVVAANSESHPELANLEKNYKRKET